MLDHYSEDLGVGSQEDGAVGHFMEDARVAGEGDAPREGKALPMIADVSVGLQGSWRFFSFTRILQLVQDPFSARLGFHSFDALYKSSRITLLSYLVSQLNTVIFNPCFATDIIP